MGSKIHSLGSAACLIVSISLTLPTSGILSKDIFNGLLPSINHLTEVSGSYDSLLREAGDFRPFWEEKLLAKQKELTLVTFSSTLGINLLFALPLCYWEEVGGENTIVLQSSIYLVTSLFLLFCVLHP